MDKNQNLDASLRLSGDTSQCINDRLSYSTDGTDLDFVFEDDPFDEPNSFNMFNTKSTKKEQPKSIKKRLFDKYKKLRGKEDEEPSNDILTEFDKIFQIKQPTEKWTNKQGQEIVQRPISWLFRKRDKHQTKKKQQNEDNHHKIQPQTNQKEKQKKQSLKNLSLIQFNDENDYDLSNQINLGSGFKKSNNITEGNNAFKKKQEVVTSQTLGEMEDSQISQPQVIQVRGQNVKKQQHISPKNYYNSSKQHIYQEEQRIPVFLRKTRFLNSLYPNFFNQNINLAQQKRKLEQLCKTIKVSHQKLVQIAINTLQFIAKPKYYNKSMSTLSYFMTSRWENHEAIEGIQIIKPRNNISFTQIKPEKIQKALVDYQEVIEYYTNNTYKLDPENQRATFEEKYKKIRTKLWSIEKNLRFISEDIYKLSLEREHPNYVYWYLNVLKSQMPKKKDERIIKEHKRILRIVLTNRQKGDSLSNSEVGLAVKNKLQRQLKFLCPF